MELYRNGLKLTATIGLDESRGSVNVPVRLLHNEKDEYLNYTEQIHIRYLFDNQVKEEILPTNDNGFYIPGKPLSHNGPIELAVHLINGNVELVTNELSFIVNNAPNGTTQVDPSEFTWQQLVDQYVNAKLDTFADKADMNKFKDDVNANLSNQDKKITDLQNTTKVSLDSQNTKIDNFKSEVNTSLSNQNTSINQTTSAQNSKITTLEGRMDTFTRLSEGSTTGDAELKDIRVGANSLTYNTAGDAVRGQYNRLKEDLVNGYVGTNSLVLQKIIGVTGVMQYLTRVLYDKKLGTNYGEYSIVDSTGDTVFLFKKGLGFITSTKHLALKVNSNLELIKETQGAFALNLQSLQDNEYFAVDGSGLEYLDFDFTNDGKIPYIDKNVDIIPKTNFGTNSYSEGLNTYGTGVPCFAPFRYNGNVYVTNMSNYALYDLDGRFISSANIGTDTLNVQDKIVVFFSTDINNATIEFDKKEESTNQYNGKQCSVFGDSLTADAPYYPYLSKMTGLNIKNCGIGGTRVSGTDDTAFWQDMRINTLEGDFICIMGGTNDAPYAQIGNISLDNKDTNTFVGAYNVMLSKIYYRYNLTEGYYTDIDYSGVNKLSDSTIFPNIIIITNPARFDIQANYDKTKEFAKACEQIAEMWNIPCVDSFNNMGMNWCSYKAYFGDTDFVHYKQRGRAKLACLIANKFNELYANYNDQAN